MLDIKVIRSNPDAVKTALNRRNGNYDADIDRLLEIDRRRREVSSSTDAMKAEQNLASKQIPAMKKEGKDASGLLARMKELSDKIKECDAEQTRLEEEQRSLLLSIPNMPNPAVPDGKDDAENQEMRRWGEPRQFDFEAKAHWDIGAALGIL